MIPFTPGQRWLSETQTELGLGLVTAVEGRQVSLFFPATGETRRYAWDNAPLSRVRFQPGERVRIPGGPYLRVMGEEERDGIFTYICEDAAGHPQRLLETRIDPHLPLNRPRQRLLAGRFDRDLWFDLRHETWLRGLALANAPVRGLVGPRVSPIPHQLYIAAEVASRAAPRVLLADEVGLGKTIEAGLILHRLLLTGQVARVLALVPEPLLHQWLVEMRRRFNLRFALFDRKRLGEASPIPAEDASDGEGADKRKDEVEDNWEYKAGADNPFLLEAQVLCPLVGLMAAPVAARDLLAADWDLLIVDEAHHLGWSEAGTSPEYELVAALAARTPGVLLLTATPEQLGRSGHFGRLRLLDPHRWRDYAAFLAEEADYVPIARLAGRLLDGQPLNPEDRARLQTLGLDGESAPAGLIAALVDRHGTSRVLFRNTRAAIRGFPAREPLPHPLAVADLAPPAGRAGPIPPQETQEDQSLAPARVAWLARTLRQVRPEKLVVICARAKTAIDLRRALLEREGLPAALFHEGMDMIERDRAAAFFADGEEGAQALICSEIGGEGRNFQFAHHLVLFDLPLDPDLLEQRIGRLDRIGQTQTIRIHIPYLAGTAEEALYRWYQEGLDAFAGISPAAAAVYERLGGRLRALLARFAGAPAGSGSPAAPGQAAAGGVRTELETLLAEARRERERLGAELAAGRDRLLELHSHRPGEAARLVSAILEQDADTSLRDYMSRVWDCFGIDVEHGAGATLVLRPGAHGLQEHFPGLPEDGLTLTFDRGLALAREDREFLTWEHPMTRGAMAMILESDLGSCALSLVRDLGLATGSLLLEMIQVLQCPAPPALGIDRFLAPTALRLVLDAEGHNRAADFPPERLRGQCLTRNRSLAQAIIQAKKATLEVMLEAGDGLAAQCAAGLEAEARARMNRELGNEIERLRALARINPNVRPGEIQALEERRERLSRHLGRVRLHLDALRLVVAG